MKVTLEAGTFPPALKRARTIVEARTTIPILATVKLAAGGDTLDIAASNLDMTIATSIAAGITTDGAACIDATMLAAAVATAPSGSQIEIAVKNNRAHIEHSAMKTELPTLPAEDWPVLDQADMAHRIETTPATLERALVTIKGSISTEETRYYLCGVFWHAVDSQIVTASTDGHQLSWVRTGIAWPGDVEDRAGVIVPRLAIERISGIIGDAKSVIVSWNDRLMTFEVPGTTFTSKLIDGTYPDYQRVIPTDASPVLVVKAADLVRAVRSLIPLHSGDRKGIALTAEPDAIVMTADDQNRGSTAVTRVKSDTKGWPDGGRFGFNGPYICNLVGMFGDRTVRISAADPGQAALIEADDGSGDLSAVLMPMRV